MSRFAISACFSNTLLDVKKSSMRIVEASNKAEAVGIFLYTRNKTKELPSGEHVSNLMCLEIEEEQEKTNGNN